MCSSRSLWIIIIGAILLVLPPLTRGLLSDYKICADSQCESLMSRVQAIRDHAARDCRFLTFRRGDVIFVYHKLTGRRHDLWAGSMDRQFGYFQKDAVTEEQVYTAAETVVETRDYDFFCMDENGSVRDSSHLDDMDEDEVETSGKRDIEPARVATGTTDGEGSREGSEGSATSATTAPPASTQSDAATRAAGTHGEKDRGEDVPGTHRDTTPVAGQKASSSSSWLGSSVTGWLGLAEDGQDGEHGEDVQDVQDEALSHVEDKATDSLASSVSGWLGFGGEESKPEESTGEEKMADDGSMASAVTGWLGLGDESRAEDTTTDEPFRSRRLALDLDLDANRLKERGTFDWLGDGLTSALGFGSAGQETGQGEEPTDGGRGDGGDTNQEVEPSRSRSWMDVGLRDVLGFGSEGDETGGVGSKDGGEEQNSPSTDSQKDDASQPGSAEERKTEPGDEREPDEERKEEERETAPSGERREEKEVGESETETREFIIKAGDDGAIDSDATHTEETEEDEEAESGTSDMASVDANEDTVHDILNGSERPVLTIENPSVAAGEQDVNPLQTESDTNHQSEDNEDENRDTKEEEGEVQSHDHQYSTQNLEGGIKGDDVELDEGYGKQSDTGSEKSADESESHGVRQEAAAQSSALDSVDSAETLLGEDEEDEGERERGQAEAAGQEHGRLTDQIVDARGSTDTSVESQISSDRASTEQNDTETEELNDDSQQTGAAGSSSSTTQTQEPTHHRNGTGDGDDRNAAPLSSDTAEDSDSGFPSEASVLTPESVEGDADNTDTAGVADSGTEEATPQEMTVQEADADYETPRRSETGEVDGVEALGEHPSQESDGAQTSTVTTESGENNHHDASTTASAPGPTQETNTENIHQLTLSPQITDSNTPQRDVEAPTPTSAETDTDGKETDEETSELDTVTLNESSHTADIETETKPLQPSSSEFKSEKSLQTITTDRQQSVSNEEGTEDEMDVGALYSETTTDTESLQEEEEKREEEDKEGNNDEERRQEEEESLDNNNHTWAKDLNTKVEAAVVEGLKESCLYDSVEERMTRTREGDVRDDIGLISAGWRDGGQEIELENRDEERREEVKEKEPEGQNSKQGAESDGERKLISSGGSEKEDIDDIVSDITVSGPASSQSSGELNGVIIDPTGAIEHRDNNPLYSDETESSDHREYVSDEDITTEGEDKKINLQKHNTWVKEEADKPLKINNDNEVTGKTEREGRVSASHDGDAVESKRTFDDSSDPARETLVVSEYTNTAAEETESGGAFGLFMNTFSYFSPTPSTENQDPSEPEPRETEPRDPEPREVESGGPEHRDPESRNPEPSGGRRVEEIPEPQASTAPEPERDTTTTHSTPEQVHIRDLHPSSPSTVSRSQAQPEPSSTPLPEVQASSPPQVHSAQPRPHSSQTPSADARKTAASVSKQYKRLLVHVSVDEAVLLLEVFGRHKLQWLDYNLGSSEAPAEDREHDLSILSDMEGLLHHHMDVMLVSAGRRPTGSPQEEEEEEESRMLLALRKLHTLLGRMREDFIVGKSDVADAAQQEREHGKQAENTREEGKEWMGESTKEDSGHPLDRLASPQSREGVTEQVVTCVQQVLCDLIIHGLAARKLILWLTVQVVSALPDDIRPGPDVYGLPWEPVIVSSLVGLVTLLLFSCRCYSSVKSRMYRSRERHMAVEVAELLNEKCKVLETLSKCQHEYDELEMTLRDSGVLAQTEKTEHLEATHEQLERSNHHMERDMEQLKEQLDRQREDRLQQERRIAELEESMRRTEEETKDLQSQEEQAHTSLKVYNMNSDRLQRNLDSAAEENTLLQQSNAQLQQETEGWVERVGELEEEMRRCEVSYGGMQQDEAYKDESIKSLTDRLLKMRAWDSEEEEEGGGGGEEERESAGGGGDASESPRHVQKVQKLIYAAKLNADLKSVDEDKDRVFAKLNDEVRAKEELQDGIKDMEREKSSLQLDSEHYKEQVQRLQQKLQIMTEMYQENELKLHRLLTVEEKERMQKEEKLTKADRNITLAMEELNNYRQRAVEMEEELGKTSQSYQTQISAHEKKAHNNWLAARAAERELTDTRRENALLRQKITDTQFKMDTIGKDPYALDSLARPLPYRGERSPYGPSPLGRPGSETRPFLSPPTLMEGPPLRLSPRVPRGPLEPPGGQGEAERSGGGGPHSDSGSISPTWERDRRGAPPLGPPPGPPGYMYPDGGPPMYRRPPPPLLGPPGPRGLPPFGPPPPGALGPPHPADRAEPPYLGPGDHEHREPLERRTPPEAERRMMGDGPPAGPTMDGAFPRRHPYGPDFYPPRGPGMGGPPMMPMRAPPPHPGMMFPPRFPPGAGPPPHFPPSSMRPPAPDAFPPYGGGPPSAPGGGGPPGAQRPPSPPHGAPPPPQHDVI